MKNHQFVGRELPDYGYPDGRPKTRQFVALLQTRPGEWCLYRTSQRPWNGHSVYRKNYPGTDWATRKVQENPKIYGVYGRWIGKDGKQ